MSRLKYALKSPVDLFPADYSDVICGTSSTGGEASFFLISQPGIDSYQLQLERIATTLIFDGRSN
ncbi:predicted protein [Botrytis cinerea T4]|uniref:Uncharacterized protein n=1 Tax=Botryotinia fuckeliana (strain T4) TaxID=999810 RepID=G2XQX1_BOTF4|nr:predicted protein [Botrytis cinerea T4]